MGQQIMDRDLTSGWLGLIERMSFALPDTRIGKGGQEVGDRLVQLKSTLLIEHHKGQRGHGFGHRVDAPDRVRRYRSPGGGIRESRPFREDESALARYLDGKAGKSPFTHMRIHPTGNTLQPSGIKPGAIFHVQDVGSILSMAQSATIFSELSSNG
jgi:hypothetical protein